MSSVSPSGQQLLLLRAGIVTEGADDPASVARALGIGGAAEARAEQAALLQLQTAAGKHSCGDPPAWVHVPAGHRLVLVDPALASPVPTAATIAPTLGAAPLWSSLVSGWIDQWANLAMPALQG
jgi:hypothetical protein